MRNITMKLSELKRKIACKLLVQLISDFHKTFAENIRVLWPLTSIENILMV